MDGQASHDRRISTEALYLPAAQLSQSAQSSSLQWVPKGHCWTVGASVGASVASEGEAEGDTVGDSDASEGDWLGLAEGDAEGLAVGDAEGEAVGDAEGDTEGKVVGEVEGLALGVWGS